MDKSNPEKQTIKQKDDNLPDKYRVSWLQVSEASRQSLCDRLGLKYTHVNDEILLRQIAGKQQALYRRSQEEHYNRQKLQAEKKIKHLVNLA